LAKIPNFIGNRSPQKSMSITEIINQLKSNIGQGGIILRDGANEASIEEVERACNVTLPDDFKEFYRFSDGFEKDEDTFNFLPLRDIIYNKNAHHKSPLYIAEFMIYCDMWQLEINPDNCNDYKIIVEANYNKLVLTKSLAEFIMRVIKGDVFGAGGLYEWQEEVEMQPIYSTKLKTAETLLTVFYHGLKEGFISKKDVVDWADGLIMREDEPESFFIDLSLGHNEEELTNLLYSVYVPENNVAVRAILGLVYHRLADGTITLDKALTTMDNYDLYKLLTRTEKALIMEFTDKTRRDNKITADKEFAQEVWNFLSCYQKFEILNYKDWFSISEFVKYKVSRNG
jgi:hypothetical protein